MIQQQISYGSGPTNFTLTWPATMKPFIDPRKATRVDTDSYSGVRQSVFFRSDILKTLTVEHIPDADVSFWQPFIDYAVTGAVFTYYPDVTDLSTHADYTLNDTDVTPARVSSGMNKITMVFRLFVT